MWLLQQSDEFGTQYVFVMCFDCLSIGTQYIVMCFDCLSRMCIMY